MACRDEIALAARLSGLQRAVLDLPDQVLRETLACEGHDSEVNVVQTLRSALLNIFEQDRPCEIFAPAAIGETADGRLLFDTVLSLFAEGHIAGELHLYEDEPAVLGERQIDEFQSRFESSYLGLSEYFVDIGAHFAEKLSLIEIFRAGLDQGLDRLWPQSARRNAWLCGAGVGAAERFWKVDVASIEA
jgi:hypothetical protein